MLKKGKIELLSYTAKVRVRTAAGKVKVVTRVIGQDDKPVKLKYFDEVTAMKIVKGTLNRDILQRWLDEERRHKVKKALRKQIKPLITQRDDEDDVDDIESDDDF